ncbi:MAG: glycosyltransferase family 4 protein [Crenarchaeota archaeon]|nr:glycosyltransferase family 4 protein [Thermoproteota archaeon]
MKVLYDHQIFTTQNYGGISRYFCELMDAFSQKEDISFSLAIRYSYNENLIDRPELEQYWTNKSNFLSHSFFSQIQKISMINYLYHLKINHLESIHQVKTNNYDVFHPTNTDTYFLRYLQKKPFVITVHDMIHELYPEYYPKNDPTVKNKKQLMEKANHIIAISENTKKDIIRINDIDPSKISVIYHANPLKRICNLTNLHEKIAEQNPKRPYILFVGSRSRYKNFVFFVKAITPLFKKHKNLKLFCAGGGSFTPREVTLFKELNIYPKIFYFPINDNSMRELYENAEAFIFPSLYEGFGLPILEAFSCGCPLVVSNTSSLSEIAAEAASYINPYDAESILHGVESLLEDPDYRDELIKKGYERLKEFSWKKTAEEKKKIYDNLLN